MATLPTRSWSAIVSTTVAGIQGRASTLIDFGQGSPLRAIVEGFAGAFLWLQAIAMQILTSNRLSTSTGTDVDTFAADFMPVVPGTNSPRLGAQAASGQLTFSRYTAGTNAAFIPVGATVQSVDGSQNYVVTGNALNPNFSANLNGYTLPSSVASVSVSAQAVTPGAGGNVSANTITVMTSPITGIDAVTNLAAFTNGENSETDTQLKARFSAYILGLAAGDYYGTAAALEALEVGVQFTVVEDWNYDGTYRPGYYYIVADDGSGYPSPQFLVMVSQAVQSKRPLGEQASVFPPTVVPATVSMQIRTAPTYDHNTVVAQVTAALTQNINGLGLGNALQFSILSAWAYAIPGVAGVSAVYLNSRAGDSASLNVQPTQTVKVYEVLVS